MSAALAADDPAAALRSRLVASLRPTLIEINDDSEDHLGHGADGCHLSVRIVAPVFSDLQPLARHRLVYEAAGCLPELGIHALSIEAIATTEASSPSSSHISSK